MKRLKAFKIFLAIFISLVLLILITDKVNVFSSINQVISYDTIPSDYFVPQRLIKNDPKSFTLQFDNGFHNDLIEIKSNNKLQTIGIASTDNLRGFAKAFTIRKEGNEQIILIKINGIVKSKFTLNKDFSVMHVSKDFDNKLTLTYTINIWIYD